MLPGGAAVAAPTTPSSPRPAGRLSLLFQQPGGGSQQNPAAKVGSPLWRRSDPGNLRPLSQPQPQPQLRPQPQLQPQLRPQPQLQPQPQPPSPKTNSELKDKWGSGVSINNTRMPPECAGSPKTDGLNLPQWKRKQEPEKKPEEAERKIEPLWKRIRETKGQQEPPKEPMTNLKVEKQEQQPKEQTMERRRPEPLWKKKQEPGRIETKPEPDRKNNVMWKKKDELTKVPEPATKQEPEKKVEIGKRPDPPKIEPSKKLDPLWKRKFEPVKTPEPELKNGLTKKVEPIWKRKTEGEKKPEPTEIKQEPAMKPQPPWKRKIEGEKKQEPTDIKQEPTPKPQPIWKRKKEPEKAPESPLRPGQKKEAETEKKTKTAKEGDAEQNAEDAKQDETEELLCPMCSELYDEEEQQPILLPRCGHTFCRPCLISVKGKGHFPCPTCRKRHLKPPVEELPIHSEVLKQANAYREDQFSFSRTRSEGWPVLMGRCASHKELLLYWCRDCQAPLCASCRVTDGHDVVRTKVVLKEKREELKEHGQTILDNVLEEKRKIMDSVTTCSAQLLQACESSVAVDDSTQNVKEMLSSTKQTADLGFVLNSLQRMKSILGFFTKATASDADTDESKTPKSRRKKDRRAAQTSEDANTSEEKKAAPASTGSKMDTPAKQEKSVGVDAKVQNTKETRVSHQPPAPATAAGGGVRANIPSEVMVQGPLLPMSDASLWPLTCCVYGEDGRRARLAWEGGKLHMHALSELEQEAHFMIKLSVIQSVVPQDQPEVFLEVEAGERRLGRIYIRLWGHLRRAHHFLALCMGTHGPSYRGAKFEEVFSRGLKGECLHAGPYLTSTGDLSAQRVMDGLEWDGQYKKIQRKGLVVGAGSGRPDRESCFDICTIENPNRHFACPFGEVVDGWDTIAAILEHRPVRAVTMVDVGVVVPSSFGAAVAGGVGGAVSAPTTPAATRTTTATTIS
ncbi:titin-like isoform X3 [Eriocheir sinensis]|uniref:titin-like isoform X3 n=1 Tax=Eriocheir sinensis TaxID=95602 RepID=UPI0021C6BB2E|nr:titin-like isoform X3 [Eriocheir sinensis]